jgi:hypothetical protein
MRTKEHELNEAAYRRLEQSIKTTYPYGQFVAFVGGEIVADAAEFDDLHPKLKAVGKETFQALVVQAGHVYPKYAVIFWNR